MKNDKDIFIGRRFFIEKLRNGATEESCKLGKFASADGSLSSLNIDYSGALNAKFVSNLLLSESSTLSSFLNLTPQ
ncbi:hypothetical protein Mal15_56310 [Stieleria maiorica]|uniref:Uncharacterized protein n=1 Tax=Stieleria maiorica TaxID=2795974 RepID=A0A5B9MKV1_9BACT|nr:hypothetical protein Mal15_56310 [Stieleria maiorica]